MDFEALSEKEEELAKKIVDAAYAVHKALGPGLLEKVYEVCFCHELSKKRWHKENDFITFVRLCVLLPLSFVSLPDG